MNNPFNRFDDIKIDLKAYHSFNEDERTQLYIHLHNHFLATSMFLSGKLKQNITFWETVKLAENHFMDIENYEFLLVLKDFTQFCKEKKLPVKITKD
jgi:hypothetical protein